MESQVESANNSDQRNSTLLDIHESKTGNATETSNVTDNVTDVSNVNNVTDVTDVSNVTNDVSSVTNNVTDNVTDVSNVTNNVTDVSNVTNNVTDVSSVTNNVNNVNNVTSNLTNNATKTMISPVSTSTLPETTSSSTNKTEAKKSGLLPVKTEADDSWNYDAYDIETPKKTEQNGGENSESLTEDVKEEPDSNEALDSGPNERDTGVADAERESIASDDTVEYDAGQDTAKASTEVVDTGASIATDAVATDAVATDAVATDTVAMDTAATTTQPVKRRHECKVCGKTFSCVSNLSKHRRTHSGEKPFECKECGKRFKSASNLAQHNATHSGERPYVCRECGKGFAHAGDLRKHEMIHSGEKPFECTICSKKCIRAGDLKKHLLTHTGEKPHECQVCGKRFRHGHHLTEHSAIHMRGKPYECRECGARFDRAGELKLHCRLHKGKNRGNIVAEGVAPNYMEILQQTLALQQSMLGFPPNVEMLQKAMEIQQGGLVLPQVQMEMLQKSMELQQKAAMEAFVKYQASMGPDSMLLNMQQSIPVLPNPMEMLQKIMETNRADEQGPEEAPTNPLDVLRRAVEVQQNTVDSQRDEGDEESSVDSQQTSDGSSPLDVPDGDPVENLNVTNTEVTSNALSPKPGTSGVNHLGASDKEEDEGESKKGDENNLAKMFGYNTWADDVINDCMSKLRSENPWIGNTYKRFKPAETGSSSAAIGRSETSATSQPLCAPSTSLPAIKTEPEWNPNPQSCALEQITTVSQLHSGEGASSTTRPGKRSLDTMLDTSGFTTKFEGGKKVITCDECGKTFTNSGNFKQHYRVHTGEKPFKCDECGKTFTRGNHLTEHKRTHSGDKPHQCSDCGRKFSSPSNLSKHFLIHTGEKPFECEQCGKRFTQSVSFKKHCLLHSGERPHECEVCGQRFADGNNLTKHLLIHTGERPYECTVCGKKFTRNAHLIQHKRTHTGERPYECLECGKKFVCGSNLSKHMQTHSGEKPFECKDCGGKFTRASSLRKHALQHSNQEAGREEMNARVLENDLHMLVSSEGTA